MLSRALAVAVLALGAAFPSGAAAAPARIVEVATHYHSTPVGSIDAHCLPAPLGATLMEIAGGSIYGDDPADTWVGRETFVGCLYVNADGSVYSHGRDRFVGTAGACGTGTLAYTYHAALQPPGPDGARHDDTVLVIVPGSGTGGLRDVKAGFLVVDGTATPDLIETGTIKGWLYC